MVISSLGRLSYRMKKRFRTQFFWLYLSIFAISLVTVLLELAVILASVNRTARRWPAFISSQYVDSVIQLIGEEEDLTPEIVLFDLVSLSRDRISGFIIRDEGGRRQLQIGEAFRPSLIEFRLSYNDNEISAGMPFGRQAAEETEDYELKVATWDFIVNKDLNGQYTFTWQDTGVKKQVYSLPETTKSKDVAGTIRFIVDEKVTLYFDIIVFPMSVYPPTKFILDSATLVILLLVPFTLILALIFSWRVSKNNSISIKRIVKSLSQLSHSDYDVNLPPHKIEEFNQINDSIAHLAHDLKANQQARKEWIRSISHDLNTPITSSTMLIDGAIDGVFPLDENLLKMIKNENDTLKDRIASVAYFAHLLSPDVKVTLKEFEAVELIDEVLSGTTEAERVVVSVEENATIYADAALSARAVKEVVNNALQYGDGDKKIEIIAKNSDIKIINKGKLPNPRPDFFEPWARGDQSRHEGGSGMGLPITGQIMTLLNGKVTIGEKDGYVTVDLMF